MTNTDALNKRIKASGLKKSYIAKVLCMAPSSLAHKIANRREFRASEIEALCDLLGIESPEERMNIFFAEKVA